MKNTVNPNGAQSQVAAIQRSASDSPRWKDQVEEVIITESAKKLVDKIFNTLIPLFPAWHKSVDNNITLGDIKLAWAKALMANYKRTGKRLNLDTGLAMAAQSESDFFPSVGKFMSWCADKTHEKAAKKALWRFNNGVGVINAIEKETRARCGYEAKRHGKDKSDAIFIDTYMDVIINRPDLLDTVLLENKDITAQYTFENAENQAEINQKGIDELKKLLKNIK